MKMSLFISLSVILTVAVSTDGSLLRHTRQPPHSYYKQAPPCFNGGTPIYTIHMTQRLFCVCPDEFSGRNCEIDNSATCYVGLGLSYRGRTSQSESDRECLEWDPEMSERVFGTDIRYLGLGKHNYCRNPDYSRKPWCYVRSPFGAMKEYCNIPHCAREPTPTESTGDRTNGPNTQFKCGERPGKLMKVVGGLITPVETHPWMAAIFKRRSNRNEVFHCGGSLISPCWVLTAAHCFPDGLHEKAHKFSVYLGKNAINETDESREQKFKVTDVILHENFDDTEGNFNNDIALLRISGRNGECAVETRSARTVCLAPQGHSLTAGVTCEIAGYGKERQGLWYNSQYLREGKVNLLAQDLCSSKSYYGSMITDNMVCAGSPDWTTDACKGDSGGPLVCTIENRLFLYGIISWGEGCSREFRPGVYTRVTNYNEWIEQKTGLAIKSGNAYP